MVNPHNDFTVAVTKDSQIVGCTLLENLFTDYVIFHYTKGLCCLLSGMSYYWKKEKRKRLRSTIILLWIHKRPSIHSRSGISLGYNAVSPGH